MIIEKVITSRVWNHNVAFRRQLFAEVSRIRRSDLHYSPPPDDVAEALFHAFYKKTVGYVTMRFGDRECAIEATQEAFVRAFERFGTLKGTEKFGPWIVTIALNAARDILRRRGRETVNTEVVMRESCSRDSVEDLAIARENVRTVQDAISLLPDHLKSVVFLYHCEGHDMKSISEMLQIPEGTVKSRLHRGRAWIREFLEREGEPANGGEANG